MVHLRFIHVVLLSIPCLSLSLETKRNSQVRKENGMDGKGHLATSLAETRKTQDSKSVAESVSGLSLSQSVEAAAAQELMSYIPEGQLVVPRQSREIAMGGKIAVAGVAATWLTMYGMRAQKVASISPFALSIAIWSCSSIGMNIVNKLAVTTLPLPFTLLIVQMCIGIVLTLVCFGGKALIAEIVEKRRNVLSWAVLTLPFTGMLITSMLAIQMGSVTFILVAKNMLPLVTLFAEKVILPSSSGPITLQAALALVTVTIGTMGYGYGVMTTQQSATSSDQRAMHLAAVFIAVNMVMTVTQRLLERYLLLDDGMRLSFGAMSLLNNTIPIFLVIPLLIYQGEMSQFLAMSASPALREPSSLACIFCSGCLGLSLGYWGIVMQKAISATSMLTMQSTTKVSTILLAMLVLGDHFSLLTGFSIVVSLAGALWYGISVAK